jgi:lysophospholipase L1-like esterase
MITQTGTALPAARDISAHELERPTRWDGLRRMAPRVAVYLCGYLVACAAFGAVRRSSLFLGVLAIFAVGLIAIQLHRVVRDADVGPLSRWSSIAAVGATGVGLVTLGILGVWEGSGFYGVALLYVGIGLAIGVLRSKPRRYPRRAAGRLLAGSVALTLTGVVTAALGLTWGWWLVVLGVLSAPIGIALCSEVVLRLLQSWRPVRSVACAAGGLVLLAIGVKLLDRVGIDLAYLAAAAGVVVLVMLAIAARSNIDVVFVIAVAAVVWTLGQQSVPEPDALQPRGDDELFAALGDSYMSGEGADEYYEGTNAPGQSTCRRAPTAYPPLLGLERGVTVPDHLIFRACSGADIRDVVAPAGTAESQVTQLRDKLDEIGAPDNRIAFVLVSMGGNDALFGTIGRTCLLPIDCTDLAPAFRGNLASVDEALDSAYADLRAQLPGVRVVVVPYPVPLHTDSCDESIFSPAEHAFLHDFTSDLNRTIAESADDAGFPVVDTMPTALAGLKLCEPNAEDTGVNFLAANSVVGTLEQSLNPTNWLHNSLHPNARGHEAMRSALVTWLSREADLGPFAVRRNAATQDSSLATLQAPTTDSPCLGERGAALADCAREWASRETARRLVREGWRLLPLVLGAWLLALPFVRLWWAIFDDQRSRPAGTDRARAVL